MAINDPYDRTGQYSRGDAGPKAEGFAHGIQASGSYVGDRRDAAVATMVGDGYRDNREGYGAILDTIENRIAAVERFNGTGAYGFYGRGVANDYTLENVVTARSPGGSYQFSNWSPKNKDAYAITQAAYRGRPLAGTGNWYDQAMDVYDTFYGGLNSLRGIAQGGTFYQNAAALSKKNASFQANMQALYGALPVGQMNHVVTGPGLYAFGRQAYDPVYDWSGFGLPADFGYDFEAYDPVYGSYGTNDLGYAFSDSLGYDVLTGQTADDLRGYSYGDQLGFDEIGGYDWNGFTGTSWADNLGDYATFTGTADPMQPDAYGYATPTETLSGFGAQDIGGWDAYDDLGDYAEYTGTADPMAPDAYGPATASWNADPMQPDAYGPATATWTDDPMAPEAYATPQVPGVASMTQSPFALQASLAPQQQVAKPQTTGWSAPAQQPVQQRTPRPQAPAAPSVPMGVVGGTGTGTETARRRDGTIADRAGGYGTGTAFGPNDPFGGMGFSRSAYGGYADVVDSYDKATNTITRSIFDRQGNLVDQSQAQGGWGVPRGVDGIRADGRGDRDTGRSGGERGDGSYSEHSGYNDNSPQGIY